MIKIYEMKSICKILKVIDSCKNFEHITSCSAWIYRFDLGDMTLTVHNELLYKRQKLMDKHSAVSFKL